VKTVDEERSFLVVILPNLHASFLEKLLPSEKRLVVKANFTRDWKFASAEVKGVFVHRENYTAQHLLKELTPLMQKKHKLDFDLGKISYLDELNYPNDPGNRLGASRTRWYYKLMPKKEAESISNSITQEIKQQADSEEYLNGLRRMLDKQEEKKSD